MEEFEEKELEYVDNEEITNDEESIGLSRYQINSYSVDRSIETLIKWKENKKLIVPDFQRDYVWSYGNSCRFIDSILLSLPIPNIFVFKIIKNNQEEYLLVDGMQRITTIEQFKNGQWKQGDKDKEFKIDLKNSNWHGKTYKDLDETDKQFFLDYPLSMMIFETTGTNKHEISNSIFSVFERINTGSEKLSDQEIRNAVYEGKCLFSIKEKCRENSFEYLVRKDKSFSRRGKNIEFFIRLLTYSLIYEKQKNNSKYLVENVEDSKITKSKRNMLNCYLFYSNNSCIDCEKEIDKVLKACNAIYEFDDSSFYNIKRNDSEVGTRVHEVFAEALVIAVINNNYSIDISKVKFNDIKLELWRNKQSFYELFTENTTDPVSVEKRAKYLLDIIKG